MNLETYENWSSLLRDIESGLSDYFSGSYCGSPILGKESGKYYNLPYIRNLKNERKFTEKTNPGNPQVRGEIWGGAFWDIREQFGQEEADKLLFLTWQALLPDEFADKTGTSFVRRLLSLAPSVTDKTRVTSIREIFRSRSLSGSY